MIQLFISIILAMFTVNICHADIVPADLNLEFGTVASGSNVQPEVTIINTSSEIWLIVGIADTNSVSDPFSVFASSCANTVLQPGSQCSFMVLFSPESEGDYSDSFNIEIDSPSLSYEILLNGVGGPATGEPDILVSFSSVNFGVVDVLDSDIDFSYRFDQIVKNSGDTDMNISSIDISGADAAEINITDSCVATAVLSPGGLCSFTIEFKPLTPGDKYAEISINTNDPDESVFNIGIRGTALEEDDGVPAVIEDAGPNNGDGNNDDILDSRQSNVVTLVDSFGNYVTYLTENTFRFNNMSVLQETEVAADFVIGSGIFDFAIEGLDAGQSIEVGIILPAGMIPGAYYMYGATVDNPDQHWFNFDFDGETGAFILGDATFTTSSGEIFTRSLLKVIFKDGGRGDTDLTVNGTIAATSAMPISQDSGGSGTVSLLQLLCLAFILILARNSARLRSFSGGDIKH